MSTPMAQPGAGSQAPSSMIEEPGDGMEAQQRDPQQQQQRLPSNSGGAGGASAGAREVDSTAEDDLQPSKRQRQEEPASYATSQPSSSQFLTAFLTPGGALPAADSAGSLVGAPLSGIVDVHTDSCCFVTVTLAGQEFKGALFSPPASFLEQAAPRPIAAAQPAPLKKPRTAFNFYSDAVRPGAKEKHPRADQKGISKIVGDMWAQLPVEEREPYNEQARQDKERYERELRSYQARFPQGSRRDLQRSLRPTAAQEQQEQRPGLVQARHHAPGPAAVPAGGMAGSWPTAAAAQPVALSLMPPLAAPAPSMFPWGADVGQPQAEASRDAGNQPSSGAYLQQQQQQQQQQPAQPQNVMPRRASLAVKPSAATAAAAPPLATLQALLQQVHSGQAQQSQQQQPYVHQPPPSHQSQFAAPQYAPMQQLQQQPAPSAMQPSPHSLPLFGLLASLLGGQAPAAPVPPVHGPGDPPALLAPVAAATDVPEAGLSPDILSLYSRLAGLVQPTQPEQQQQEQLGPSK